MIFGIQASGDVKLSEIARSLNERIALSKTETRLSRNLARDGLEEALLFDIAKMGARRVRKDYAKSEVVVMEDQQRQKGCTIHFGFRLHGRLHGRVLDCREWGA